MKNTVGPRLMGYDGEGNDDDDDYITFTGDRRCDPCQRVDKECVMPKSRVEGKGSGKRSCQGCGAAKRRCDWNGSPAVVRKRKVDVSTEPGPSKRTKAEGAIELEEIKELLYELVDGMKGIEIQMKKLQAEIAEMRNDKELVTAGMCFVIPYVRILNLGPI